MADRGSLLSFCCTAAPWGLLLNDVLAERAAGRALCWLLAAPWPCLLPTLVVAAALVLPLLALHLATHLECLVWPSAMSCG